MADIYITQEVAKMIGYRRKIYTRHMPQPVLCITGTPKFPMPWHVFQDEIWYYCPHCHGLNDPTELIQTLMDDIMLCPKCYGPLRTEERICKK